AGPRFRSARTLRRSRAYAQRATRDNNPSRMVCRCRCCHSGRWGRHCVYNDAMEFDAVVVGSGPNGLAAAIEIAQAGHSVCVLEARETIGGGARSAELTLPGFVHDVCSAIHPLAIASPFFRSLPLSKHGLAWIQPPAALAHPFDDGT